MREIFSLKSGFSYNSSDFVDDDIILKENSSNEILKLVIEMIDKIDHNKIRSKEIDNLEMIFWKNYKKFGINKTKLNLHGKIKSSISSNFLLHNREFYDF